MARATLLWAHAAGQPPPAVVASFAHIFSRLATCLPWPV